jgi:hypothetical protein
MSVSLSKLIVEMLEEQAALIKKQIEKMKNLNDDEVGSKKELFIVASQKPPAIQKKIKQVVDPNRPKRPSSGYQLFMSEQTPIFKEANNSLTQPELMSAVAKKWTSLSNDLKSSYITNAEKLKIEYLEKIKIYDSKNTNSVGAVIQKIKSSKTAEVPVSKVPENVSQVGSIVNDEKFAEVASNDSDKKKKKKRKNDLEVDESPDKKKKVMIVLKC